MDETSFYAILKSKSESRLVARDGKDVQDNVVLEKVLKHLKTYLGEIKTDRCKPHDRRLVQKHINRGKRIDKIESPQCDRNCFNFVEDNKAQNWQSSIKKPSNIKPLYNRSFTSCSCITFTNTKEYQRNIPKYDRTQDPYCIDANTDTKNSYYRPSTPISPQNLDRVNEPQSKRYGTVGDYDNDVFFRKEKTRSPFRDENISTNHKNQFMIHQVREYEVKYRDTGDNFRDEEDCPKKQKDSSEKKFKSCKKNSASFCLKRSSQKSVHRMTNHRAPRKGSHTQKSTIQSKRLNSTRQPATYNNQGPQFVINNRRLSKPVQSGRHNEGRKNTKQIIEPRILETERKRDRGSVQNGDSRVISKKGKYTKVEIRSSDLIKPMDKLLRLCDSCERNPCTVHDTLVLSDMIMSFLKVMNNPLFTKKSAESSRFELQNIKALEEMKNILLMASKTKERNQSLSMIQQNYQTLSAANNLRHENYNELNETITSNREHLTKNVNSKSNLQIQNVTKNRAIGTEFSETSLSNQLITTYQDEYREKQENHNNCFHESKSSDERKKSPQDTLNDELPLKSQVANYLRTLSENEKIPKNNENTLYSSKMDDQGGHIGGHSFSNQYHENQKGGTVSSNRQNDGMIQRTDFKCYSQIENSDKNENFMRRMSEKYEATTTPMYFRNIDMADSSCVYRSDYPNSYFTRVPLERQVEADNAFRQRGDSGEQSPLTEFSSKVSSQHNFRRSSFNRTANRFQNLEEEDTTSAICNISEYAMNTQMFRNERHQSPTPVYRMTNGRYYNNISIQSTPGIYNQKKIQTTLMPKTDANCQHNRDVVSVLNVYAHSCKPFFKKLKKEGLFSKVKKFCRRQPKILYPSREGASAFGVAETTVQQSVCCSAEIRDNPQNKKIQTEYSTVDFNKPAHLQNVNEIGIQSIIDISPMTLDKDVYKIENADCYVQTKFKSKSKKIQIPDQDKYLITPKSVQVSRCEIADQGVNVLIEPTVFTVNNKNTKQFFRKCLSKYQALKRPLNDLQEPGIHFSRDSLEVINDFEKPQKLSRFMDSPSPKRTDFEVYPEPTRQVPYFSAASGDIRMRRPFEEGVYTEHHSLRRMNSFDFYRDDLQPISNGTGPRYDIPSHTRHYEQTKPITVDYTHQIPKEFTPKPSAERNVEPKRIIKRTKEHLNKPKSWFKTIRLRRRPRSKPNKMESNSVKFSKEADVMPFYGHETLRDQYRPEEYSDQILYPENDPRFGYHVNTVSLDRNSRADSLENVDLEEEESPETYKPPRKIRPFHDRAILFI